MVVVTKPIIELLLRKISNSEAATEAQNQIDIDLPGGNHRYLHSAVQSQGTGLI
jgi:hypothetical protein